MGWTYSHRGRRITNLQYFQEEFRGANCRLVDMASSMRVAYGVLEISGGNQPPYRIAIVCLLNWVNGVYNFGYKDMTEDMGPVDAKCPRRILDQLTPLDELAARGIITGSGLEWARNWRERCEQHLAAKSR